MTGSLQHDRRQSGKSTILAAARDPRNPPESHLECGSPPPAFENYDVPKADRAFARIHE